MELSEKFPYAGAPSGEKHSYIFIAKPGGLSYFRIVETLEGTERNHISLARREPVKQLFGHSQFVDNLGFFVRRSIGGSSREADFDVLHLEPGVMAEHIERPALHSSEAISFRIFYLLEALSLLPKADEGILHAVGCGVAVAHKHVSAGIHLAVEWPSQYVELLLRHLKATLAPDSHGVGVPGFA